MLRAQALPCWLTARGNHCVLSLNNLELLASGHAQRDARGSASDVAIQYRILRFEHPSLQIDPSGRSESTRA